MNKGILFTAALSALAMVSCNREQHPASDRPATITVSIQTPSLTRATGIRYDQDEADVDNLQVFVFKDGELENYGSTDVTSVDMTATTGTRQVWAIVNAPDLSGITTLAELTGTASLLSDNDLGHFVMSGDVEQELTDGATVYITVRRIVARVSIEKIETSFQFNLAKEKLQVDGIYLINVAADNTYLGASEPEEWVNQLRHEDRGYDALLFDGLDVEVDNDHPYEAEHVFYPYPNPTVADIYADEWSPRHTMLVIEVTFQGEKGYYPIPLPVIERNKAYVVRAVDISSRPGDDPYKPIETGSCNVTITVHDWETGEDLGTIEI